MTTLLFYDTETTGLPLWNKPSSDPGQPHICQLAATLTDGEGNLLSSMNTLIKPDGWTIPDDLVKIHGISTEKAERGGVPLHVSLALFINLWSRADLRIGFNESFDARMVRIALMRESPEPVISADNWKAGESYCAMKAARPICKIPNEKKAGTKNPNLGQAFKHFTGLEHVDAHDAMADVNATEAVYFGIQAHLEENPPVENADDSMPDF